ncbi:Alpha/beta hydrolase fold-1 [Mycena polygramma]|nr:Alpha/beta hydrolase fold-1 [Mycena polygramma]
MSTPTKPTIIIIPASFTPLFFYNAVIAEFETHGYSVHGIELETVGRREKPPSMYDDAAKVASRVTQLADEGKDVVLVAHSYGGLVACESAKGLAKSAREEEGKRGGVMWIVFVSAMVPREGQALTDDVFLKAKLDRMEVKDGYMMMDPVRSAPISFPDLAPEEALSWASKMREHAAGSFREPLTYGAYKDIPISYLVCEEEKGDGVEMQNRVIARMESEMGGRTVDRHVVQCGHCITANGSTEGANRKFPIWDVFEELPRTQ